ncbi:MAG: LptF/LptG family permease [Bacteroidota bacterium]
MKRLHFFIIKSFIGPFILTFFISMFLLLMQFLWKYIDDLVGKGLEFSIIAELLFYTSASLVPMALPLAILLASLMTFGNLGENYELLALKAAGISLQRIMKPLIIFTVLVSIGAFFFSNNVLPVANLKFKSLLYDVRRLPPELSIRAGVFNSGIEGFSIRVSEKDPETGLLEDIQIYNHSDNRGNVSVTIADSGYLKMTADESKILLTLYNGYSYNELKENARSRRNRSYPHQRDEFTEQQMIIPLPSMGLQRSDESLFKNAYSMKSIRLLEEAQDSIKDRINDLHEKYTNNLVLTNLFKKKESHMRNRSTIPRPIEKSRIQKNLSPDTQQVNPNQDSGHIADEDTALAHIMVDTISQRNKDTVLKVENDSASLNEQMAVLSPLDTMDIHLDTVFNNMGLMDQQRVISLALSYARNTHSYVKNNNRIIGTDIYRLRRHEIEWHRKFTLAFACFIFFFIGAPLGAIIRKGGLGMPVIISVLFFILYYMITITTEKFAREDILSAFMGMWTASMILLPTGMFLTYKATTDSVILNIETYTSFLKKIFVLKGRKLTQTATISSAIFEEESLDPDQVLTQMQHLHNSKEALREKVIQASKVKNFFNLHVFDALKLQLAEFINTYVDTYGILNTSNYLNNKQIKKKTMELPALEASEFEILFISKRIKTILSILVPVGFLYFIDYRLKINALRFRLNRIDAIFNAIEKAIESTATKNENTPAL